MDINTLIEIGKQHIEELYSSDDNTMNNLLEFFENEELKGGLQNAFRPT